MFFEIPSEEGQKREEVETNQNKIKSFLQSFTSLFSDSIYHFPLQNYIVFFGHFSRGTPCKTQFSTIQTLNTFSIALWGRKSQIL